MNNPICLITVLLEIPALLHISPIIPTCLTAKEEYTTNTVQWGNISTMPSLTTLCPISHNRGQHCTLSLKVQYTICHNTVPIDGICRPWNDTFLVFLGNLLQLWTLLGFKFTIPVDFMLFLSIRVCKNVVCIRGGWRNQKFEFELTPYLIPFSLIPETHDLISKFL